MGFLSQRLVHGQTPQHLASDGAQAVDADDQQPVRAAGAGDLSDGLTLQDASRDIGAPLLKLALSEHVLDPHLHKPAHQSRPAEQAPSNGRSGEDARRGTPDDSDQAAGRRTGADSVEPARSRPFDDSIRCRVSGICDAGAACQHGPDGLGCVTDAAERKKRVQSAISWAWRRYRQCAWGQDELHPLTCGSQQWFGLGLTLVDSLDTLIIAGLSEETEEALEWVRNSLDTATPTTVNLFETTIRVLGGLLSAYHLLGGDRSLVRPAADLGLRLLAAFDTPSGIPLSDVTLADVRASSPAWTKSSSLSEATTLSLEFGYLAQVLGRPDIAGPARAVHDAIAEIPGRQRGLVPIFVNPQRARFDSHVVTLGARGDSYYEYLLKQWVAGGYRDARMLAAYEEAMAGVRELLLARTAPLDAGGLLYVGELDTRHTDRGPSPKMDHLVCFLPGLLALGHLHGINTGAAGEMDDLQLAQELMYTCYQLYQQVPLGLAPELVYFRNFSGGTLERGTVGGGHFSVHEHDTHNLLRPETVESLFVLWRVTEDERYRDWGWQIFRAFEAHARHSGGGYTNLESVVEAPPQRRDKMESFFIAETLKYLFLLFEDDSVLPLEHYVFNTEAHPLPIVDSAPEQQQRHRYLRAGAAETEYLGRFQRDDLLQQLQIYSELLTEQEAAEAALQA